MKKITPWLMLFSASAAAIALGSFLGTRPAERMPGKAERHDVLSVLFGDARLALGQAMAHKADSYFHGGVNINWHERHHHKNTLAEAAAHHHGEAAEEIDNDEDEREQIAADALRTQGDPWAWINHRIHAQEHRHLTADHARELLPWYWAACRANPHDLEAYQSSAYVLSSMMGESAKAVEVLEEGIRQNPGSAALEFDRGQIFDTFLKNRPAAERAFQLTLAKAARPDIEENRRLSVRALFYLAVYAKARGDFASVEADYAKARRLLPNFISTHSIGELLQNKPVK